MDPTEHVQEHLQHTAAHGDHDEHGGHGDHGDHGHGHSGRWITAAALTAAILAAFAAVSGAASNSHLMESTHNRIKANDQWLYYQSKSIKSSLIDSRMYAAQLAHVSPQKKDVSKKAEYDEELPKIQDLANTLTKISDQHVEAHETYEIAETMFHISIAIVAIAVVAKRRSFWYVSMIMGLVGVVFFGKALTVHVNPEPEEEVVATAPAVPGGEGGAAQHASTEAAASHPAGATVEGTH